MPAINLSAYQNPKKPLQIAEGSFSLSQLLSKDISFGSTQLNDKKKEAFYLELSTLLSSGIDLKTALELILLGQEREKEKTLYHTIKEKVLLGNALSQALKLSNKFSDYEYFSICIGEETGRIAEVLTDLATYFKSKIAQRRKVINAVTYPVIVLSTSMGAVFFMLKFVVPMFADVFQRFGGKLPFITALVLKLSAVFNQLFFYGIILLFMLIVFFTFNKKKHWFRQFSSIIIMKTPVVGEIVRKIYLARFANTMRLLVSTDTPLLRSIALVRQMIGFYPLETSLEKVEQAILKGATLHQSLGQFSFYPAKMLQLIKVGEEVNRLDYFFEKIASQYTEEVEYRTSTISSFLEPLIIIFLGLVVGLILIAMYLPMFQMSNSF